MAGSRIDLNPQIYLQGKGETTALLIPDFVPQTVQEVDEIELPIILMEPPYV